jgi:hypothetical protein
VEYFPGYIEREREIRYPFRVLFQECNRFFRLHAFFGIYLHEQDFVEELINDGAVDMALHPTIPHIFEQLFTGWCEPGGGEGIDENIRVKEYGAVL